jgi:hypothetical protein
MGEGGMKPDWDNAPSWAKYFLTQDDMGWWGYFEEKPYQCEQTKLLTCNGRRKLSTDTIRQHFICHTRDSLEDNSVVSAAV